MSNLGKLTKTYKITCIIYVLEINNHSEGIEIHYAFSLHVQVCRMLDEPNDHKHHILPMLLFSETVNYYDLVVTSVCIHSK